MFEFIAKAYTFLVFIGGVGIGILIGYGIRNLKLKWSGK